MLLLDKVDLISLPEKGGTLIANSLKEAGNSYLGPITKKQGTFLVLSVYYTTAAVTFLSFISTS